MIKKFEEFINEGIIMKTIKRSLGNGVRKEDDITLTIKDFMEKHNITDYTINPDKSVDVNDGVRIDNEDLIDGKLPFKFGKVKRYFDCSEINITSLEGCPEEVGSSFYCSYNELTTLEGAPKEVGGFFDCSHNNLTSLEGCPKEVGGFFDCSHNNLTSLKGCPKEVGDDFYCEGNSVRFTKDEVEQYCKVKGRIFVYIW